MKFLAVVKLAGGLAALGYALLTQLSPQTLSQWLPNGGPSYSGNSERYTLVPGSIYDGDTFRVSDGSQELKIRLCGIDAPEADQALGTESRDHLRSLVAQGNGQIILIRTDTDQYGRTIAEAFIPLANSESEIHLNSQMVADGMAYVYPQYVGSCPNAEPMRIAERAAKADSEGVWANPMSQKPWEYRRRS
ncbi:MAG: thermonuclease family protein [Cyanobacteria bacterium J06621_11]